MRFLATLVGLFAFGTHGGTDRQHTIASATVGDFRIVARAIEGPDDGGAPLASVRLEAFVKKSGTWRLAGRTPSIGSTWRARVWFPADVKET